jgi:serine/threonine protein kinase/Tol biopolymer transport system component
MQLSPGTKLGPYEILAPLGAGGMGEVYRARDTRLGREVAIKVLPQHLSSNAEVRARFEREAKTVSSLNHPNICTLFDVGREGETDYLVMELIDGETLAGRVAKGALSANDALKLAIEIADALDKAHRAGIIHRDLKPGNVMLTKSGAKLMDFGLARVTGLAGGSSNGATMAALTQSPTIAHPLTAEGTIVGTFQYMSPEQLDGREADVRSDVWALGCVVYEMTTGRRAFNGATQASLISAIMRDQPRSMTELAPMSPPPLERVVLQCLAKDPDDRWQSAGDIKRELDWIRTGSSSSVTALPPRRRVRRTRTVAVVAGAVVAAAALAFVLGKRQSPQGESDRLIRFEIASPPGATFQAPAEASLSPDGKLLAFVAAVSDSTNAARIYVRPLGSTDARALAGTDGASLPFWSPDGRTVGFFAKGKLLTISLDGGQPVVLCDAPDSRGADWSADDVILFAPSSEGPIARVSARGGSPKPVTTVDATRHEFGHRYPQFLPDGKHFLYVAVGAESDFTTFAASLDAGTPVAVCKGGSAARYAPPGFLLYLEASPGYDLKRLLAQRFDAGHLRTIGDPILVSADLRSGNIADPNVSVDDRGTLVVQHFETWRFDVDVRDRRGTLLHSAVKQLPGIGFTLSPDGRRLAYAGEDPSDLWVRDVESGVSRRLTFNSSFVFNVLWSRDGKRIAYSPQTSGTNYEIRTKWVDGSSADSLLFRGPALFAFPVTWSTDGRWLVAQCTDSTGAYDLWRIPMTGQGRPEIYQRTIENESTADLSPDGRWMAYVAGTGGKNRLYVDSFPNPGSKHEVAVDDPSWEAWPTNGELIVVDTRDNVFSVPVTTSPTFESGAPRRILNLPSGTVPIGVARGGELFLTMKIDRRTESSRLEVVVDWPQMLQEK